MPVSELRNTNNEKVGELHLNEDVFCVPVDRHFLHTVVKSQLASRRAGNACTKTRVEVHGSSIKPFKQKGTGKARSGSKRSPLWRGGGVSHGPKPRNFALKLNKKARRLGVKMAISARFAESNLILIDSFEMEVAKTRNFLSLMNGFDVHNALIVVPEHNDNLERSSRNVHGFKVLTSVGLNVYDVLNHKHLILIKKSVEQIEKRLLA